MHIRIIGAYEHNLKDIDVDFRDGLTAVTGVSGSGKTSLVFDTLFRESQRRFREVFAFHRFTDEQESVRVRKIAGLGPAVALGQDLLNRNPNSIVATASGLHPLLRLLYARFGKRYCHVCGAETMVTTEDQIIAHMMKATTPTGLSAILLKDVPGSHRTLLQELQKSYPGRLIIDGRRLAERMRANLDPAEPHTIELMSGITKRSGAAAVRNFLGQVRAMGVTAVRLATREGQDVYALDALCSRCDSWLPEPRPIHFHTPCSNCAGSGCRSCEWTGLHLLAAHVLWMDLRLPDLLRKSIDEACRLFRSSAGTKTGLYHDQYPHAAARRILQEITMRLEAMQRAGLGYIQLDRQLPTLSRGEAQRLRIAVALVCQLEDMLHILDEPTIGQHPVNTARLLDNVKALPGPVIFIEHDRLAVAGADHCVDLGPGAGEHGGEVLFAGRPADLWRQGSTTGRYFSRREMVIPDRQKPLTDFLRFHGAHARNLQDIDVGIPLMSLTVITGVSGSGKSTLVEEVIDKTLRHEQPQNCRTFTGQYMVPLLIDQSPIGKNPRSNPATYTKTSDVIRDLFASRTGRSSSCFSFNRREGACPACQGLGALEVRLKYLPSVWITCTVCGGKRFNDDVLRCVIKVHDRQLTIADIYDLSIEETYRLFKQETRIEQKVRAPLLHQMKALIDVGLGYLSLGQESPTLSGGEAQRVKLAKYLGRKKLQDKMIILDEPTTGLHPFDVAVLLKVLTRLIENGATIVAIEHDATFIRAADWIIDLGPGAGPAGGKVVYEGDVHAFLHRKDSITARMLKRESRLRPRRKAKPRRKTASCITMKNVSKHNLKNITVSLKKGNINVITGVSGSGKSSLVHDVLEQEARKRFLESLSMYERQNTHERSESDAEEITGLGLAVSIGHERKIHSVRATAGSITGLTGHLATLFSFIGDRTCPRCRKPLVRKETWVCPECGFTDELPLPRYFSPHNYHAACITCHGIGALRKPNPEKLIIRPDLPLCAGAMYSPGFFPKGFLCKPYNSGYDMVQGLAKAYGFDPATTPWECMAEKARHAFLYGTEEKIRIRYRSRTGRERIVRQKFPGFYKWVGDWDTGGTYTDTQICPACSGARLKPQFLAIRIHRHNFHDYHVMPLKDLFEDLRALRLPNRTLGIVKDSLAGALQKLRFLSTVGLGYLHLAQPGRTLSCGEVQRIRIAALLSSELTGITVILDEPTRGMHPGEVHAMVQTFCELTRLGNTLVIVEHDPDVIRNADMIFDLGPGSGRDGGRVQAQGTPAAIKQTKTKTGMWLRTPHRKVVMSRRKPAEWMTIRGARENNLRIDELRIPLGVLTGVCGVSGSGKSTLMIDTIARILAPKKYTTSVAREEITPGAYRDLTGSPGRTLVIDQSKAGVYSPVRFMGLKSILQKTYAASDEALQTGVDTIFRKNCTACQGRGRVVYDMGFLPDVGIECSVCQGSGYPPEVKDLAVRSVTLPVLMSLTVDEVFDIWQDHEHIVRPLDALRTVGLGYLVLEQSAVSGGEAQRMKIAYELAKRTERGPTLFILDEPTVGLHLDDICGLIETLQRVVSAGNSVVVIEHQPMLLSACDYLIELGPGGGPEGGRVIAEGTPVEIARLKTPTAPFLRSQLDQPGRSRKS
jgi:excinuclease ABC subunit A